MIWAIAFTLIFPFVVGYAYGRNDDDWETYLNQVDYADHLGI
jgi:hypothetical protein